MGRALPGVISGEIAPRPEPGAAEYVDSLINRGLLVEFDPNGRRNVNRMRNLSG